jgi:hypothetical protein
LGRCNQTLTISKDHTARGVKEGFDNLCGGADIRPSHQTKGTVLVKTLIRVAAAFIVFGGLTALAARAAQFPLQVRDLDVNDAMTLPGGHGAYGSLSALRPAQANQLPATKSKYPLFSTLVRQDGARRVTDGGMVFMFDESQGTGKGYDRLVVDLNGNGDLTDDPVWERIGDGAGEMNQHYERQRFGPVPMPETAQVGAWRPRFYVEVFVFNREILQHGQGEMLGHIGQMRVRSGNLLMAEVEVNDVKQRLGLVDGNLNFRIGDPATTTEFTRSPGGRTTWYLMPSDYLLRDLDGSGSFRSQPGQEMAEPLSSLAFFGGKPFSLSLAKDLEWIRFEPYPGATGQLDLGSDVAWVLVGRQMAEGSWEALSPALENGKTILPAGTYRVSNLAIQSRDSRKVRLTSYDVPLKPLEVVAGQTFKAEVGTPIRLDVTAQKRAARPGESLGVMGAIRNMFGGRGRGPEDAILEIGVSVFGRADEAYSGFSAAGEGRLPPPRFEILAEGKAVASGDFEYG